MADLQSVNTSGFSPLLSQVTSNGYRGQVSITRPNDTNAYSAGDVVGTSTSAGGAVITFAALGPVSGSAMISSVDLRIDASAVPAGMTSFRLYLYSSSPASALGDNGAWDLPSGDRSAFKGYVDLGVPVDLGSTLFVQADGVNKHIFLDSTATMYGYLVTNGGFTPAASTNFAITLRTIGV